MFRKCCLIMLVLTLMTGSAFASESRIDIQLVIHGKDAESAVTADMLIRDSEIIVTSGLFPSYALSAVTEKNINEAAVTSGDLFDFLAERKAEALIQSVFQVLNADTSEGVYSGDLFDSASIQTRGSCTPEDLLADMSLTAESGEKKEKQKDGSPLGKIGAFIPGLSGLLLQYTMYDNGRYFTFNVLESEKTLLTFSCDFSDSSAIKALAGYSENGKNYYWNPVASVVSEDEIHFSSSLYADEMKKGFRSVRDNPPVVTESWKIKLSEDRKGFSFAGEIVPENKKNPIDISGAFSESGHPALMARISFRDWEDSYFTLSADKDESPVNTEGLAFVSLNELPDQTVIDSLAAEITGNGIPFLMKILLALPEEYQNKLFFPD